MASELRNDILGHLGYQESDLSTLPLVFREWICSIQDHSCQHYGLQLKQRDLGSFVSFLESNAGVGTFFKTLSILGAGSNNRSHVEVTQLERMLATLPNLEYLGLEAVLFKGHRLTQEPKFALDKLLFYDCSWLDGATGFLRVLSMFSELDVLRVEKPSFAALGLGSGRQERRLKKSTPAGEELPPPVLHIRDLQIFGNASPPVLLLDTFRSMFESNLKLTNIFTCPHNLAVECRDLESISALGRLIKVCGPQLETVYLRITRAIESYYQGECLMLVDGPVLEH